MTRPCRHSRSGRVAALGCASFSFLFCVAAPARAADPAGALDELKRGYTLKQAGNCRDALAHFARSAGLDPTAKALLNESDCEQRLGDPASAREHAASGLRLAIDGGDAELAAVARDQLAAIEPRVAWLVVRLGAGAPADASVREDDQLLAGPSLGDARPVNAGVHTVTVTAAHRVPRVYSVALGEGQRVELDVEPGVEMSASPAFTAGWIAGFGLGAAGLALGVGAGVAAGAKHEALLRQCAGDACPPPAGGDLDAFRTLRTWSTVGYVVGAAGLVGAGLVWFIVPRSPARHPSAR
ncbi:MAG: hypothetical protein JOZ69_02960, partial [Myxococcales bacterium]|nr:hypothetical protein [Myxococcales bacterium]